MATEYRDLVLENGELVSIEINSKYYDKTMESIEDAMKIGGWWSPCRFDGNSAKYLGHTIDRVNMKRVVAML